MAVVQVLDQSIQNGTDKTCYSWLYQNNLQETQLAADIECCKARSFTKTQSTQAAANCTAMRPLAAADPAQRAITASQL
jgi:hypothetical protein